jgi:hypothetical protein
MKTKTERREAANELYLFWYKLEQEACREDLWQDGTMRPNREVIARFLWRAAAARRWKNQAEREARPWARTTN